MADSQSHPVHGAPGASDDAALASLTWRALFDALPDPAAMLDSRGMIAAVNAAFTAAYGPGRWTGRALDDAAPGFTRRPGPDGLQIAFAAPRALEQHAAALERSNRELERFATVASHDLQEPLRKISAFASLLARRYEDRLDAEGRQSLAYLVDAAVRMRGLIEDLLAYSRTSNRDLEIEPVDLNAVLAAALDELSLMAAEACAEIECGPLPSVRADLILMQLLFQNLLSNALKYRKGAHVRIVVRAERERAAWRITVADDGIGFDPRFSEKVFAPFQRLHNREAYAGTGIGLAICQQAVERHGGRIWVDTEPGFGARFHFTLPDAAP